MRLVHCVALYTLVVRYGGVWWGMVCWVLFGVCAVVACDVPHGVWSGVGVWYGVVGLGGLW